MSRLWLLVWCASAAFAASDSCAECHRAIYDRYRRTPMARSSGAVASATAREASFTHAASGFRYRIAGNTLEFDNGTLRGRKELSYFVGSGATARSYLLAADGFLFEAPVSYYSAAAKWDLAPGYDRYAYPYLTRPILPGCLACHASFLQTTPDTQNGYATPPFREGGVACERCHGSGEAHAVVNPAKLAPDRRDSICAQCHLSGEARVFRRGADWRSYRPGDRLGDSISTFVRARPTSGIQVTSHVENFAQSRCKQASGDRMWCGTCHDPHGAPDAAELRRKCAACHAAAACKETTAARAKRQDDCLACHMPKSKVTDAQHVVYTDHSIPRRPRAPAPAPPNPELVAFGAAAASTRDLALAYAIANQPARALKLLEAAERAAPDDVEVLVYLAEAYRNGEQPDRAVRLYRRAMQLDPSQLTPDVGLGAILFQRGEYAEAIRLWQIALSKNPGLDLTRTNLAMAQWRTGDLGSARATLERGLDLSPGFQPAADLLKRLRQR